MGAEKEREALKKVYPGPKFLARLKGMKDNAVIAMYLRLKSEGKLK